MSYLAAHQSPGGGFCFYRTAHLDEPNLADTFHAVATFHLLGEAVPRADKVARYLDRFDAESQPHLLYYVVQARRMLEAAFAPNARTAASIAALSVQQVPTMAHVSGWLERTRLVMRLQEQFGHARDARLVVRALQRLSSAGGFGARPNLRDTWLALDTLDACGDVGAVPDAAAFVDTLQARPFGFTATRVGTDANLDVIHAGTQACRVLSIPIRYPDDALQFVLACQARDGGFARTEGALPSIEYTYHAVAVLAQLRER